MADEKLRPDTLALHADEGLERAPDVAPPIHVSTTFDADNDEGLVYARAEHPTRRRLEAVLGALEGGHAVVYASGQAAATAALLHLRPRRVAIARGGYHGTHLALDAVAPLGVALEPLVGVERERVGAELGIGHGAHPPPCGRPRQPGPELGAAYVG